MTEREKEIRVRAMTATAGPWQYDVVGTSIYTSGARHGGRGDMHLADIRGWGYLTGGGGAALPPDTASNIQDRDGVFIACARDIGRGNT